MFYVNMIKITSFQEPHIRTFSNSQNNHTNKFEKSPVKDTVNISFKQSAGAFLDSIKYVPSNIWINDKLIGNPNIKGMLKPLQNFSLAEKKNFVTEYCNMTGFPNLKDIAKKINTEITTVINQLCQAKGVKPLFISYEGNCSVAREKAFPGSDCDGFFIITDKPQCIGVNRAELGFAMNQRVVNSTGKHFPEVFTIEELMPAIEKADSIYWSHRLWKNEDRYMQNLSYNGNSFIEAATFNIDIAEHAESSFEKDMICHAALFVENLRAGKVLANNINEETLERIRNSIFYKYSNITRTEGLHGKLKPKLINREQLCKDFQTMNDEEKFQVCKYLLETSMGVENSEQGCNENFDMGDILELYKKISSWIKESN